jgi:hypothetical protein
MIIVGGYVISNSKKLVLTALISTNMTMMLARTPVLAESIEKPAAEVQSTGATNEKSTIKAPKKEEQDQHGAIKSIIDDQTLGAKALIGRAHQVIDEMQDAKLKDLASQWLTNTEDLYGRLDPKDAYAYDIRSARLFYYLNAIGTLYEASFSDGDEKQEAQRLARKAYRDGSDFEGYKTSQQCLSALEGLRAKTYSLLPPPAIEGETPVQSESEPETVLVPAAVDNTPDIEIKSAQTQTTEQTKGDPMQELIKPREEPKPLQIGSQPSRHN